MDKNKILGRLSYSLDSFKSKILDKRTYKILYRKFKAMLYNWKDYKPIRNKIEDFLKLMKNGVGYTKIPAHTYKSAAKNTFLNVLLAGIIITHLTPDTTELQRLAEW